VYDRAMADDDVTSALAAALEHDPENVVLRVHLCESLVDGGRLEEALRHARLVLRLDPANLAAQRIRSAALNELVSDPPTSELAAAPDDIAGAGLHASDVADPAAFPPVGVPDSADDLVDAWKGTSALAEPDVGDLTAPSVRLADVGGMERVKSRLESSFLAPVRNPDIQKAFGKSVRGGLMLWGPPGCGKTFIARAIAGELGARFYDIGLADILDMWLGKSEQNVHAVFEFARSNSPCVLFLDEVDALGIKRTHLRVTGVAMRGVVNQLLAELDGASSRNDGVFVLAATNHPWDVDMAPTRPGRLDRSLLVLPPDAPARASILKHHLRGRPTRDTDVSAVAAATQGYSGADLALICEEATERAMSKSIELNRVEPITQDMLLDAARAVRPSVGPWFEVARNYALYSNHDGAYDELLAYLKEWLTTTLRGQRRPCLRSAATPRPPQRQGERSRPSRTM